MHGTVRNFTNLGELWEVNSRFTADILLAYLRRCGQFLCFSDQEYDWQGKTVTSRAQYKHCYLAKMLCLSVCPPGCVFVHNFVTLLECQQVSVRAHWAHKNLQNTDNMRWAILWEVYCVSIRLQIHTRKHVRKKKATHLSLILRHLLRVKPQFLRQNYHQSHSNMTIDRTDNCGGGNKSKCSSHKVWLNADKDGHILGTKSVRLCSHITRQVTY